jgi:hypothetical protein
VSYLLQETERGTKGANDGRSLEGRFMYIENNAYVIMGANGKRVTRHACTPLNELALARVGIPAGGATVETGTQITGVDAPPLQLMQPNVLPPRPAPAPIVIIDPGEAPKGTRLRVWWKDYRGEGGKWYEASVVRVEPQPNGSALHILKYDGFNGEYVQNLARDRATGRLPWFVKYGDKRPKSQPPAPPPKATRASPRLANTLPTAAPPPQAPLTRAAAQLATHATNMVNSAPDPLVTYNTFAFSLASNEIDRFEASNVDEIEGRMSSLMAWHDEGAGDPFHAADVFTGTVHKAASNIVVVDTELGKEELRAPSTMKELKQAKDSTQWLEADRKALDVAILGYPENQLVPITVPKEAGIDVDDAVLARRYKTENGKLAAKDPRKSRIAVDDNRSRRRQEQKGIVQTTPKYALSADIAAKLHFLADATEQGKTLVKADVSNAYPQAFTLRGKRYLRVPEHLRTYTEDGIELVIELGTTMWGEGVAGHEWDVTFYAAREKIGYTRAEGVPGLMTHGTTAMISEVDDILISEPAKDGYRKSAATVYLLNERFPGRNGKPGVTWEAEPSVYAGLELARTLDRLRITVRAESKVIEACREHVPAVVAGDKQEIAKYELLDGKKLQRALDALQLAPPADVKTDKQGRTIVPKMAPEAKLYQRATGSVRFPTQTMPRFEKSARSLSCVAARPPRDSYRVARSVLAEMYKHRREGLTYGGRRARAVARPSLHLVHGLKHKDDGRDNGHGGDSGVTLDAGAPMKLEGHGDATWGVVREEKMDDTYGLLITKGGASILSKCKGLGFIPETSMDAEFGATRQLTNSIEYHNAIEVALGNADGQPTLCTTDNKANQLVAGGESSAARSRHALRRYMIIQQRIARGDVVLRHVPDPENPADFLTKWVDKIKFERSIEYATNGSEAVDEMSTELQRTAKIQFMIQLAALAKKADFHANEGKEYNIASLNELDDA